MRFCSIIFVDRFFPHQGNSLAKAPPSSALRAGGLGVFAFHDVPSRRFAPSFVYFEVHVCIRWSRDPFSAWGASVSDVGKVVPRNSCHVIGNLLTEEGHHDT